MTKQTYYEHRLEDLTRYGEISDGEDDVSDDEFSEHVKAPSMQDVQKKLAELQGRLGEQVDHAKSLREKLHALVPALPELRFERLRLRGEDGADDSAASSSMLNSSAMSMGSLALSPVPASTAALGQPPAGLGSSPARCVVPATPPVLCNCRGHGCSGAPGRRPQCWARRRQRSPRLLLTASSSSNARPSWKSSCSTSRRSSSPEILGRVRGRACNL